MKCKKCGKVMDIKEIKRVYGELLVIRGYCTPQCFTKDLAKEK